MPSVKEIADFLKAPLRGADLSSVVPRSLQTAEKGAIVFLNKEMPEAIGRLNELGAIACVTTKTIADRLPSCTTLIHENPRLAFCKLLERFFVPPARPVIAESAAIAPTARLAKDAIIGAGAVIGEGAVIGAGTRIANNVVIADGTVIGENCIIKSNTTIGEPGFGFVVDTDGKPVRFPHIGTVRIGNNVEIGANCTVVRAALDTTIVGDDVKTDDHVHIAHNAIVGPRTQIAAGAVLSGSVTLGADVWIGPNVTLIDYVTVGDGGRVGIGSVVARSVPPGATVFGNPARQLPKKHS